MGAAKLAELAIEGGAKRCKRVPGGIGTGVANVFVTVTPTEGQIRFQLQVQEERMFGDMFRQSGFDPMREFARVQRQMDRLFGARTDLNPTMTAFAAVTMWKSDEKAVVAVALPGILPEAVNVVITGRQLTIGGTRQPFTLGEGDLIKVRERRAESFERIVELPFNVDADRIDATFRNGMLVIEMPRAEAERPRKVAVRTDGPTAVLAMPMPSAMSPTLPVDPTPTAGPTP